MGFAIAHRLTQAQIDAGEGDNISGTRIEVVDANQQPTGIVYESGPYGQSPVLAVTASNINSVMASAGGAGWEKAQATAVGYNIVRPTSGASLDLHIEVGGTLAAMLVANWPIPATGVDQLRIRNFSAVAQNFTATGYSGIVTADGNVATSGSYSIPVDMAVHITIDKDGWIQVTPMGQEVSQAELDALATVVASHTHAADVTKQDVLVSGTNIKTINSSSVVGSGNVVLTSPTLPLMNGTATAGTASPIFLSRVDHVHPTDTSHVLKAGDTFTGDVTVSRTVAGVGPTLKLENNNYAIADKNRIIFEHGTTQNNQAVIQSNLPDGTDTDLEFYTTNSNVLNTTPAMKLTGDNTVLANGSQVETHANRVSSFQTTPDDTHYPTEMLVKNSLNGKLDIIKVGTLDANSTTLMSNVLYVSTVLADLTNGPMTGWAWTLEHHILSGVSWRMQVYRAATGAVYRRGSSSAFTTADLWVKDASNAKPIQDYSSAAKYAIGDQIQINSHIYRCITAITVPENFNAIKWYDMTPAVNNTLTSTSILESLSAAQGKVLQDTKQATLVSGTTIKTVNGASLPGSGDIVITPTTVSSTVPTHNLDLVADNYAGRVLHLRTNGMTATTNLATWSDSSGNSRDVTAATVVLQPDVVENVLNGLPVVRFDGLGNRMTRTAVNLGNNFTLIGIIRTGASVAGIALADDVSGSNMGYAIGGSIGGYFGSGTNRLTYGELAGGTWYSVDDGITMSANTTYIVSLVRSGATTTASLYKNGLQAGTNITVPAVSPQALSALSIGRRWDASGVPFWNGDIAEIAMFSTALSTTERQKIEGYLAHKYALLASLDVGHPYKVTAPQAGSLQVFADQAAAQIGGLTVGQVYMTAIGQLMVVY